MIKTIEMKLESVFNIMAFIRTVICVIFITCAWADWQSSPKDSNQDEQRMEQRRNRMEQMREREEWNNSDQERGRRNRNVLS